MKIVVAVVTRGRPAELCAILRRLEAQTRPPDGVIISATAEADLVGAADTALGARATTIFGAEGISAQRNRAMRRARDADVIVFFDDDFAPFPDAVEGIETLFARYPSVAAATGQVVADGVKGPPIKAEEADRLVAARRPRWPERRVIGLYGCNMAIRVAAAEGLEFDENLPLYGWQEDLDFGARVAARGEVIRSGAFGGVHLGVRSGRHPQTGLGYAQIANPVRLMRNRSVPARYLLRLMARNVAANAFYAAIGDRWADRPGRLRGNLMALGDLVRGRLDPDRVRVL